MLNHCENVFDVDSRTELLYSDALLGTALPPRSILAVILQVSMGSREDAVHKICYRFTVLESYLKRGLWYLLRV